MSFDLRQNLLMVPAEHNGQPMYNFYNAMGLEMSLMGLALKEIYDLQFESRFYPDVIWGYTNEATKELLQFTGNGDLMLRAQINKSCNMFMPIRDLVCDEDQFKAINGIIIEDSVRQIIRIHLKATSRKLKDIVWFHDLPEEQMRDVLLSFGVGPLRVERADKEALVKLHEKWLRKHDEEHKYTHNACGIDPDEKLPADLYADHGKRLKQRHMALGKTVDMMASELSCLIRIFDMDTSDDDFDHLNPSWLLGLVSVANTYIYGEGAESKLRVANNDPQFRVNMIYALAKDLNWQKINEETEDYQKSLVRRLIQELRNEIEQGGSELGVCDGSAYLNAKALTEERQEKERRIKPFPALRSEDKIKYEVIRRFLCDKKLPAKYRLISKQFSDRELVPRLADVVADAKLDWLNTQSVEQLELVATALTRMREGDRYPRTKDYLKDVIRHALSVDEILA